MFYVCKRFLIFFNECKKYHLMQTCFLTDLCQIYVWFFLSICVQMLCYNKICLHTTNTCDRNLKIKISKAQTVRANFSNTNEKRHQNCSVTLACLDVGERATVFALFQGTLLCCSWQCIFVFEVFFDANIIKQT